MTESAVAIAIMTGLGVFFATVLAVAWRFLAVEEDPRIEQVSDLLPGSNCGACGQPGCGALASALVEGTQEPGACTVASPGDLEHIATLLGVDVGDRQERVARLRCGGGEGRVRDLSAYEGLASCRAAVLVDGGGRACTWGCIGLADCRDVCTFDAIHMNARGLPVVDVEACTACNDCVDVCPLDLFVIQPLEQKLFVQCAAPLTGEAARAVCSAACDACGLCAADAPDVIEMIDGLPVIHPERGVPTAAATRRCPTGAIQWLEGEQFAAPVADLKFRRRSHA